MNVRDEVFREALALPDPDRKELLQELLKSLGLEMPQEGVPASVERAWEEAFARRILEKKHAR